MKRALLSTAIAALFVLFLAAPKADHAQGVASPGDPATRYTVAIDNFSFTPSSLTVPVGATVTWLNRDDVPHTIVSSDRQPMKSPVLDTDDRFTYTFSKAGTYTYFCSVHPRMTGQIVVQ
jgi:plastocyanin